MKSICRFIPAREYSGSIRTVKFVREGNFHGLRQPFYYPIHYLFLVISGTGTLHLDGSAYSLSVGDLFFSFPDRIYTIEADDDFAYLYISFMGDGVQSVLDRVGAGVRKPVFYGYTRLAAFWEDAITHVTNENANLLTEGVLLYTLSQLTGAESPTLPRSEQERRFEQIVQYVDLHYREPGLSLGCVAETFSYTSKYLSWLFKRRMDISFTEYVNNLRVQYACRLMEQGENAVAEIAARCGYADPLYFSKVFKKKNGMSPQGYMKRRAEENSGR